MSNISVNGVEKSGGKVLVVLSVLFFLAALIGFYLLPKENVFQRGAVLLGGLLFALVSFIFSAPGKEFREFVRDAYHEVRKVVWPSRKETGQATLMVFVFVLLMAIFLWMVDKLAEWGVFSLILGWR